MTVTFVGRVRQTHPGDLDDALKQFDVTASNLRKAEAVWSDLMGKQLSPEDHSDRARAFVEIAAALPAIGGFRVEAAPMSKSQIDLARFDPCEVGEASAFSYTEELIDEPGAQLREYRRRFEQARRALVRQPLIELVGEVDAIVARMRVRRADGDERSDDDWSALVLHIKELERLFGNTTPRPARWSDLRRHLHWAEDVDVGDIVEMDWPAIRQGLDGVLFGELEATPVDVGDLAELVVARPRGPVTTALQWHQLNAEGFERLLFALVAGEEGYENPNWLMKTAARDQGRDVEAYRVSVDGLSGTRRERMIVQCKHWMTKSVGRDELVLCTEAVRSWEPPAIDVLVVATTGRFSSEAVEWREQREQRREVPRVELWPDSHLEMLLARRPHIAAEFGLRG